MSESCGESAVIRKRDSQQEINANRLWCVQTSCPYIMQEV
jgi:hypothetical protein